MTLRDCGNYFVGWGSLSFLRSKNFFGVKSSGNMAEAEERFCGKGRMVGEGAAGSGEGPDGLPGFLAEIG